MTFDTNLTMRGGLWYAEIIVKENGKENEIWTRGGYAAQSTAKQQLTRMIKEQKKIENDNIKGMAV